MMTAGYPEQGAAGPTSGGSTGVSGPTAATPQPVPIAGGHPAPAPAPPVSHDPCLSGQQPLPPDHHGYHDQAQFEADKRSVYKHPLFPLLALLFEKCELATQSSDSVSSDSFNLDIQAFVQHQERDRKPFLMNDPEVDGLMIKAIQVLRIHLLELEKVQELCKDFCNRYITCLKGKMQSENLLRTEYGYDSPGSPEAGSPYNGHHQHHHLAHPHPQVVSTSRQVLVGVAEDGQLPEEGREVSLPSSPSLQVTPASAHIHRPSFGQSSTSATSVPLGRQLQDSEEAMTPPPSQADSSTAIAALPTTTAGSITAPTSTTTTTTTFLTTTTTPITSTTISATRTYPVNDLFPHLSTKTTTTTHTKLAHNTDLPLCSNRSDPSSKTKRATPSPLPARPSPPLSSPPLPLILSIEGSTPLSQIGANPCPPPPETSILNLLGPLTPPSCEDEEDGGVKLTKRGVLPKHATAIMKTWLFQHLMHPYPSEDEKRQIASQTNLTLLQVNNWFINARRRILQPMMDVTSPTDQKFKKKSHNCKSSVSRFWSDCLVSCSHPSKLGLYHHQRTKTSTTLKASQQSHAHTNAKCTVQRTNTAITNACSTTVHNSIINASSQSFGDPV